MMSGPETEQEPGLLEKIADTALDDDYYVVRTGPDEPSRQFNTVLTGTVLAVFALLIAIAAIQTRTDRPVTERERATLISDINARKALLAQREATANTLRARVDALKASVVGVDTESAELRILVSDRPATGPGLRVQASTGPQATEPVSDLDLQKLVNGFWYAGAEAISINGKRIGPLTSIRTAGGIIKINYQPIGEPFDIIVLGDAGALKDRFAESVVGRDWEARRKSATVRLDVARSDDLTVKATPKARLTINHATAIEGDA